MGYIGHKDFVVGNEYWTFYCYWQGKENQTLMSYTGLVHLKCISINTKRNDVCFEVLGKGKMTKAAEDLLYSICQGGYNSYYEHGYWDNEEDAIKGHDQYFIDHCSDWSADSRDYFLSKRLIKHIPTKSKEEIEAMTWYNTLSAQEKKHIKWIERYGVSTIDLTLQSDKKKKGNANIVI